MNIVLFDTETTDLISNSLWPLEKQPRVTEFYAVKVRPPEESDEDAGDWERVSEINFLLNPGIPIPKKSQEITGITDALVADCPGMKDVWDDVVGVFADADMVVAHNLFYDMSVMNFEAKRIDPDTAFKWPKYKVCTVEATEHLLGYRLSLTALHQHLFGCSFPEAHRAKNDTEAMLACFTKLWAMGLV